MSDFEHENPPQFMGFEIVPDETAALVERLCGAIASITGWMDPDFAEDAETLKVADAALSAAHAWQAKNGGAK